MDTIGFSIREMTDLMVPLKVEGLKEQEETTRSTVAILLAKAAQKTKRDLGLE